MDHTVNRLRNPCWGRFVAYPLLIGAFSITCCASEADQLLVRIRELKSDLSDQKQRADDLEVRARVIRARNKVLIDLIEGLTSDPEHSVADRSDSPHPMNQAQEALAVLDRDIEVLAASLRKSRAEFVELHSQRRTLQTNLADAMKTIEEARKREKQAQSRINTFRSMLLRLRSLIAESQLEVHVIRNRIVVQLPNALLFETGHAAIKKDGKRLLDDVAEVLNTVKGREFQVAGHTDDVPIKNWRYRSNWHLSAARAVNVTQYLIERGISASRISGAAYAETRPISDQSTSQGRRMNRRIEIVLLPKLNELPDLSLLDQLTVDPKREDGSDQDQPRSTIIESSPGKVEPPVMKDQPVTTDP